MATTAADEREVKLCTLKEQMELLFEAWKDSTEKRESQMYFISVIALVLRHSDGEGKLARLEQLVQERKERRKGERLRDLPNGTKWTEQELV